MKKEEGELQEAMGAEFRKRRRQQGEHTGRAQEVDKVAA